MKRNSESADSRQSVIKSIPKVSVVKETFDFLVNNIMNGTWKTGEKIPSENELSTGLQVSRHTVRQAIANLNMLGILDTRRGDGNYVRETGIGLYADFLLPYLVVNKLKVHQIIEFRKAIEVESAYRAAQRATVQDLQYIREKMDACFANSHNISEYPSYDLEFHVAIAKASQNELLYQSMLVIKKHCFDVISEYFDAKLAEQGAEYHSKIYDALVRRDSEAASRYMGQHTENILVRMRGGEATA